MISRPIGSKRPRTKLSPAARILLVCTCLFALVPAASAQTPVTNGYRDFSYGTTVVSAPTGEKPESKLWWNDGLWWASLWNPTAAVYHIYQFDLPTQTWVDTGTPIDDRASSKADTLWDQASQKLYIVSHRFLSVGASNTNSANWGRLYRYSYSSATHSYTLDVGFPVTVNRGRSEILVIAKDSTGKLWVTYVEGSQVMINHSTGNDLTWGTPFVLPVSATATAVTSDDISSIIAFGGNKIGVMWSNQNTGTIYFSVHLDTDADNIWQPEEIANPNNACAGPCADDHINLKTDSAGRVYAATKTSQNTTNLPQNMLEVRSTTGTWTGYVFGTGGNNHTRPIVLLDESNSKIYMFATAPETAGVIYYKVTNMGNISFPTGLGTPFLMSSTETAINNPTSMKQNVNGNTGLLVLASDDTADVYLHNYLPIVSPNAPVISSFTPASGAAGTVVTLTGSKFTGATRVAFNSVTATTSTVNSSTQIHATVPTGATTGPISVTTAQGTGVSATDFTVSVDTAITSFSPSTGPIGTSVILTGSGFTGATSVKFNTTAALTFTVDSDTQITATVPAGATTGTISVTSPIGPGTSATNFIVTVTPSITSFLPPSAVVGTAITINGTGFDGTSGVSFNGTAATVFSVISGTMISANVPAGATTGRIAVTNSAGTGTSVADFTVFATPSITSFTPPSGLVGAGVILTGTGFTGTTAVKFNGTVATFHVDTDAQITVTVPGGATTGQITVTNPAATGTSATNFSVIVTPSITSFTPTSGQELSSVTLTGTGFTGATAVTFNGTPATSFTVNTDAKITVTVPIGATSGKIAVTNLAGTGTSATDFTVIIIPIISSSTPGSGVVGAGVTLTGLHFTGATAVTFNGTAATAFTVITDTQIAVTVPAGATTGKIAVTIPSQTGTSAADFTVIVAPSIPSFAPPSGPVGSTVTLTGTGFSGTTGVTFNGTAATSFTVNSDLQISATVPAGATTGKIAVNNPAGTGTSVADYSVIIVPVISSFSPAGGVAGANVTLTGTHFTGATAVKFNGTAATTFTVNTDGQIVAAVPAGAATGKISVTNATSTGTSVANFTVIVTPSIALFTPSNGAVGSTVTLTGAGFTGTTGVTFNGTPATAFSVDLDLQITATVPAGATTGKIAVTNPAGTATSLTDYTVNPPPFLSLADPAAATQGQTLAVVLNGQNFVNGAQCGFGAGITVNSCTFNGATQLIANLTIAGNAAVGNRDVTVTNPDAQISTLLSGFSVSQAAAPTVALVNKTSAALATGSSSSSISAPATNHLAGNLLVVICRNGGSLSVTQNPPTDTAGNTYFGLLPVTNSNVGQLQMWYAKNILGNPNNVVACHFSSSVPWLSISVLQYSGVDPVNPLDAQSVSTGGSSSGTTALSAPFSTSQANEVIVAGATVDSLGMTFGAGSGFTVEDAAIGNMSGDEDALVTTLQTNAIATMSWSGSHHWLFVLAAFKENFTPFTTPSVNSFIPSNGPVGTSVVLSGSGFTGTTAVKFNGTAATTFAVNNDSQMTVTVPAGATTGKIAVTNPAATGTSATDYTVTLAPLVSSFSPPSGPAGTNVTLKGTGFIGTIGVAFNGTAATQFTADTDTQITVAVPAGATTGKISVTTPNGPGTSSTDFTVIVTPTINLFGPPSGLEGSSVTLTGTGFTGTAEVAFNGTVATAFKVDSDTQITVTVPAGATSGKISATNAAGTGTSATDFTVIVTPSITSSTPTSEQVGASIVLTGSRFTGATAVKFNGTAAATFNVDTDAQITVTVPAGATTGKISVTNPTATGTSATDFTVIVTPSITSFTPSNGAIGSTVTLTGSHFTGATAVNFNGTAATTLTVNLDTQITVTVPAGATTGRITVTNPAGTGTSATDYSVVITPSITSFTPTSDVVGASVTLTGSHFNGATAVKFNGTAAATFNVATDTQITVTVPAGATTGKISVTNPTATGTSATDFTVIVTPSITSFAPASGPEDSPVTLTGTGFTGTTAVNFNGTAATALTVNSDTKITVTVPTGATTGKITVTNPAGTGTSATDFAVILAPIISSFTPTSEQVGASIVLTGSRFTGATSVKFNGTPATTFAVNTDAKITVSVPAGATTGKITVTNAAETGTSTTDFTVIVMPAITSFTPSNDVVGASVTLAGSHFIGTTAVKFNGTAAIAFTVDSDIQITATVPAGATTGKITVTNPAGTGTSTTDFTVIVKPSITSFTPSNGAVGSTVTLTGTGFTGTSAVTFNGTAATTFTVNTDVQITVTVPIGATTGKIAVTNSAGTATSLTDYTVNPPPTLSLANPPTGTQGQALTVFLTGQNFVNGAQCGFGAGITVNSCTFNSATQLTANLTIAGNATVGNRDVTVTNPDAQISTLLSGFSVSQGAGPTIALVNKTSAALATGSSSSSISAPATNHLAGNLLVVICRNGGSLSVTQNPPTDTAGNTYFGLLPVTNSNVGQLQMWYAKNILGNPNNVVACHFSSSVPWLSIGVLQYSGADPVNPLDAQSVSTGGSSSGTTALSAPFSTSQANEVIVAGATVDSLGMTFGAGSGFTVEDAAIGNMSGDEDALVTTLQTNAIATMSWSGSHHWLFVVATFK
jgi:IPT/TIG domain